ncbi:MAG TPA: hypothetical protein VLJ18_02540 [Thermoanaerobaculia bacterium]|nr:hypothetical protein [Thermoanaerobaculia bacterium]
MRESLLLLTVAAGLVLPAPLSADEKAAGHAGAWFKVAMTTEDRYSRDEKTVFSPEASAVYAVYRVVATGPVKVRAIFWADAAEGLGEKTKLVEKFVSISGKGEFMGSFKAPKPANGWPVGAYRVDLFIGDELSKTLLFKVVKSPGSP